MVEKHYAENCPHSPACASVTPEMAAAVCGLSNAARAGRVSIVLAVVSDGPDGPGVDGVLRTSNVEHTPLIQAVNSAMRGAAITILVERLKGEGA